MSSVLQGTPGASTIPSRHGEVAEHLRISRDGGVVDRLDQLPGAGRAALRPGRPGVGGDGGDPAAAEAGGCSGRISPAFKGRLRAQVVVLSFSWLHGTF